MSYAVIDVQKCTCGQSNYALIEYEWDSNESCNITCINCSVVLKRVDAHKVWVAASAEQLHQLRKNEKILERAGLTPPKQSRA